MEIQYKKPKAYLSAFKALGGLIAVGIIVAIPTAIVWGMIYATTLFIGTILGG
jgi:hypothetical protein